MIKFHLHRTTRDQQTDFRFEIQIWACWLLYWLVNADWRAIVSLVLQIIKH